MLPIWIYFIFVEIRNSNGMKLIQVNPKAGNQQSILSALNKKELSLRNKQTTFYKEGKIYLVIGVVAMVFLGMVLYLFLMGRKIAKIEKELKGRA